MANPKRITVAACALFIMLGFVAGGIAQLEEERTVRADEQEEMIRETVKEEALPEETYILKIEDGIVVVFNNNDMTRPVIVTDIYASTLRHIDREQLNEGIVANGDFELYSLLEDFSV